ASRSSASAAGAAPCSGTRFSPATRSSSVAPPAGAAASMVSTSAARMAGMVHAGDRGAPRLRRGATSVWGCGGHFGAPTKSVPYSRGGDRLADVEGREEELELGVLDGVGGQHVGPERRHAPLESLAHVPDLVAVGAPRRKMPRQPVGDVDQPAAPEELVRAALGRVAVRARVIALADAP